MNFIWHLLFSPQALSNISAALSYDFNCLTLIIALFTFIFSLPEPIRSEYISKRDVRLLQVTRRTVQQSGIKSWPVLTIFIDHYFTRMKQSSHILSLVSSSYSNSNLFNLCFTLFISIYYNLLRTLIN